MGMVVRNNLMALNANRQLGSNTNAVQKSLEKLSSGFKINRAGDDASGLAISEKMKAQIKGLETASANSQDGISLIQTAEGALTEVHDMLNRMVELAEKSANGTIQDEVDRENIQNEVNALLSEIDRIGDSTNFNGINLIDGNLAGSGSAAAGSLTGGTISNFKAATTGAIAGNDMSSFGADVGFGKETITIDGVNVDVDWSKLNADEQAALQKDWTANTTTTSEAQNAAKIMQDTINKAIDETNKLNGTSVNHIEIKGSQDGSGGATSGVASFKITSGLEGSKDSSIKLAAGAGGASNLMGVMFRQNVNTTVTAGTDAAAATYTAAKQVGTAAADTLILSAFTPENDFKGTAVTSDNAAMINKLYNTLKNSGVTATGNAAGDKISFSLDGFTLKNKADGGAAEQSAVGAITLEIYDGDTKLGEITATTAGTLGNFADQTGSNTISNANAPQIVAQTEIGEGGDDIKAVGTDKFNGDINEINNVQFDMVLDGETIDITVGAGNSAAISDGNNQGTVNAKSLKDAIDDALTKYATSKGLNAEETQALKDNITVEFTKDGRFSVTNNTGMSLSFADKNGGKAAETLGIGGSSGKVQSGGLTRQVGDTADDFNKVTVSVDNMKTSGLGISSLNVSNQNAAGAAIKTIKSAINKVSLNRGNLGALQNRLEHTISNLDVSAENMTAANSRIRDTDMAKEMMNYTKMNVLTQAAQAMLAQANQQPQSILQLLQ